MLVTHLLLVLEIWDGKLSCRKSWAGNLLVWSVLTLNPSFKVKQGLPNLSAYNSFIIGPRGLGRKPTYRKSWAGNFLV